MVSPDQVRGLLDQEVENLQSLLSILRREHDALVNSDVEALEQITGLKNQALSIQANLTNSRQKLLASTQGGAVNDQLADYVASGDDSTLEALYMRLSSLAEECHSQNRTNGRLIGQKHQLTLGALDILRHTDSKGATYSLSGKASGPDQTGRSLGKA